MALEGISAITLLAGFPEPALVITPQGMILHANAAAARLLAVAATEIEGASILRFLPEEERSRLNPLAWLRRWAEQPEAPELRHVYLVCRNSRGGETPVRVRTGRIDSDPPCYMVMLQDIGAEHARQQQSRQAHRLAARVLAISADAIVNVDEHMRIDYANASAERLFGYGAGQLVGRPLADLLPERFRADHAVFMRRFAEDPQSARLMAERSEVLGLSASGEEIPLEASITKVTLDRSITFSAHLRDLRPRKAAAAALAHSEAGFNAVFENAQQAMAILQPDGTVQAMNRAGRALLPSAVNPVGRKFSELPFWTSDPVATASGLVEALRICLGGTAFRTTAEVKLPEGVQRTLDFSLWPVSADGDVFAIIAEARELAGDGS